MKSGGKSTTALRVVANAQKMCTECSKTEELHDRKECKQFRPFVVAWLDVEGAYDGTWARRLGVDEGKLYLMRPETAEQCIDVTDALLRSQEVDLLVVDSLAALVPSKEQEASAEEWQQGLMARLVNKGVRRWTGSANRMKRQEGRAPTLLLINQIREKIGIMFGDPITMPGGHGVKFAASLVVRMWPGKVEMEDEKKKGDVENTPVCVELRFKVEFSKVGPPNISGSYKMMLTDTETKRVGDVWDEADVLAIAERLEMVRQQGDEWLYRGKTLQAKSHIERLWLTDRSEFEAFKREMHEVLRPRDVHEGHE